MSNDAIKQRLIKIADEINLKLDKYNCRCHQVKISMSEWNDRVELDVFTENDRQTIIFDISEKTNNHVKPPEYLEEIT